VWLRETDALTDLIGPKPTPDARAGLTRAGSASPFNGRNRRYENVKR
jgi:hypothetical protein